MTLLLDIPLFKPYLQEVITPVPSSCCLPVLPMKRKILDLTPLKLSSFISTYELYELSPASRTRLVNQAPLNRMVSNIPSQKSHSGTTHSRTTHLGTTLTRCHEICVGIFLLFSGRTPAHGRRAPRYRICEEEIRDRALERSTFGLRALVLIDQLDFG